MKEQSVNHGTSPIIYILNVGNNGQVYGGDGTGNDDFCEEAA